jgi:predicted AlkP superfamily phosphohydrolase/phosphomutase
MAETSPRKPSRRSFLKRSVIAAAAGAAAVGAGSFWLGSRSRVSRAAGKKVIVIGIDGMDPQLCETMLSQRELPNLARLRAAGGFCPLGTSIPPQSPVAWASFINGAGPGSHGIFDFMHRHPDRPWEANRNPFYGAAETIPGEGHIEVAGCEVQLDFWPFNHRPPATELRRQGEPFWDFLDEAGVPSTFYDLPCNYPPSPSQHGHHRCLAGMGTPDLQGSYGTYQHYSDADEYPAEPVDEGGGMRCRLRFEADTASARLLGPVDGLGSDARPAVVEFLVHRDREANAAVIEIQGRRILLQAGSPSTAWSRWSQVSFRVRTGCRSISGICRFFLQEVAPRFRLYVTPVNIDPSDPAVKISEPSSFVQDLSERRHSVSNPSGLFYTAGFQEDHMAWTHGVFVDDEFVEQANKVLEERLALFDQAVQDYDDGLLFFYFSSSDLQSHMLWWNSADEHPRRTAAEVQRYHRHIRRLYQRLDRVVGDLLDRYGSQATIIVMSDHGFAHFGRQFSLNSWLWEQEFLACPPECTSVLDDSVDWSRTAAYGLGINGLYLNLKGRERHGLIERGEERNALLTELASRLEAIEDPETGRRVISSVYRADQVYRGGALALAPDLIVGYARGYRASWDTVGGGLNRAVLSDGGGFSRVVLSNNDRPWSADHCVDARQVPGILFCNRPIRAQNPSLVDMAPSILAEFGLSAPSSMEGRNIFS